METSPENFDSLQKLLKLKRYEHPHPRYFNDFSSQVIGRIQAGEAHAARPWWEKFGIDLRAVMTVGAGAAACVAFFVGMGGTPEGANASGIGAPSVAAASVAVPSDAFTQREAQDMAAANSTNPVINAAGVMRLDPWGSRTVRASYQTH
jgi:hypothetical protein